jgi:hypothetical protein
VDLILAVLLGLHRSQHAPFMHVEREGTAGHGGRKKIGCETFRCGRGVRNRRGHLAHEGKSRFKYLIAKKGKGQVQQERDVIQMKSVNNRVAVASLRHEATCRPRARFALPLGPKRKRRMRPSSRLRRGTEAGSAAIRHRGCPLPIVF